MATMTMIHPDDVESPRFGGWADDFNTYEEACAFYGADTPASLAAEEAWEAAKWMDSFLDDVEVNSGRVDTSYRPTAAPAGSSMEIPF
jgi:hypothetical protein